MSDVEEEPLASDDDVSDVYVTVGPETVRDTLPAPLHREGTTEGRAAGAAAAWGELRPAEDVSVDGEVGVPCRGAGARQQHARRATHVGDGVGEGTGPDVTGPGHPSPKGLRCDRLYRPVRVVVSGWYAVRVAGSLP